MFFYPPDKIIFEEGSLGLPMDVGKWRHDYPLGHHFAPLPRPPLENQGLRRDRALTSRLGYCIRAVGVPQQMVTAVDNQDLVTR